MVVNTNPLYTADELRHQLKDSGAVAILVLENFAHVVQQVMARHAAEAGDRHRRRRSAARPEGHVVNFVLRHVQQAGTGLEHPRCAALQGRSC